MTVFCPTTFDAGGAYGSGTMTELSSYGAQFTIKNEKELETILNGSEVSMHVKTPYGSSTLKGVLRWTNLYEDFVKCGVEFTRIPEDRNDPVRCMMESW